MAVDEHRRSARAQPFARASAVYSGSRSGRATLAPLDAARAAIGSPTSVSSDPARCASVAAPTRRWRVDGVAARRTLACRANVPVALAKVCVALAESPSPAVGRQRAAERERGSRASPDDAPRCSWPGQPRAGAAARGLDASRCSTSTAARRHATSARLRGRRTRATAALARRGDASASPSRDSGPKPRRGAERGGALRRRQRSGGGRRCMGDGAPQRTRRRPGICARASATRRRGAFITARRRRTTVAMKRAPRRRGSPGTPEDAPRCAQRPPMSHGRAGGAAASRRRADAPLRAAVTLSRPATECAERGRVAAARAAGSLERGRSREAAGRTPSARRSRCREVARVQRSTRNLVAAAWRRARARARAPRRRPPRRRRRRRWRALARAHRRRLRRGAARWPRPTERAARLKRSAASRHATCSRSAFLSSALLDLSRGACWSSPASMRVRPRAQNVQRCGSARDLAQRRQAVPTHARWPMRRARLSAEALARLRPRSSARWEPRDSSFRGRDCVSASADAFPSSHRRTAQRDPPLHRGSGARWSASMSRGPDDVVDGHRRLGSYAFSRAFGRIIARRDCVRRIMKPYRSVSVVTHAFEHGTGFAALPAIVQGDTARADDEWNLAKPTRAMPPRCDDSRTCEPTGAASPGLHRAATAEPARAAIASRALLDLSPTFPSTAAC